MLGYLLELITLKYVTDDGIHDAFVGGTVVFDTVGQLSEFAV